MDNKKSRSHLFGININIDNSMKIKKKQKNKKPFIWNNPNLDYKL